MDEVLLIKIRNLNQRHNLLCQTFMIIIMSVSVPQTFGDVRQRSAMFGSRSAGGIRVAMRKNRLRYSFDVKAHEGSFCSISVICRRSGCCSV